MVAYTVKRDESGAELNAASTALLLAIAQVEIAVALTDSLGNLIYLNPCFSQLSGYTPEDILGKSAALLKSSAHDEDFYGGIQATLLGGNSWKGRLTLRTHQDRLFETRCTLLPLQDSADVVVGYCAFFRDTSDELKLEAQLRQVQKMEAIGELAAGIAHEINTPIQYVGDNIQFLRDAVIDMTRLIDAYQAICEGADGTGIDPTDLAAITALRKEIDWDYLREEVPQAIDQALEGRNRVAEIVRAMKEFAHPGDETLTPVDLRHAIDSTLAVSCNEWKYIADIEIDVAADLPSLPCYPASFNQVLLNLVVNAAHAISASRKAGSGDKGTITIGAVQEATSIVLRVQDSGCGIAAEHRDRIFEPFYTTKDIGKGTGQGLALVHSVVVDRLGGTIEVESTLGAGTTFLLRLPLEAADTEEESVS